MASQLRQPIRGGGKSNALVASALGVFTLGCLAFPFLLTLRSKKDPLIDSSKPLNPQAIQRGPYINAGSRDIGPDPTPMSEYKSERLKREQQRPQD